MEKLLFNKAEMMPMLSYNNVGGGVWIASYRKTTHPTLRNVEQGWNIISFSNVAFYTARKGRKLPI